MVSALGVSTSHHTLGHVRCPACDEIRASLLLALTPEMTFPAAAAAYMSLRSVDAAPGAITARYIRKTTEQSYRQYMASLELFFGEMRMGEIRWFHLRAYQAARASGAEPFVRKRRPHDKEARSCPAKPKKINQELSMLKHLLQRAACWSNEHAELYQPLLDDNQEIPRALDPSEQQHWLDTAKLAARWDIVHWYSLLAIDTCMSTDEIRGLRLGDVNLYQRVLTVARKTSKNNYRARTIELGGADVIWALERLLDRARSHGSVDVGHYLFPARVAPGVWDPSRPMSESGLKKQWEEVRAASKLDWFRQYDCRHTAITRLAEAGVPVDVIKRRAGHVSEKMREHYTHISQSSQRKWMEHAQAYREYTQACLRNPWERPPSERPPSGRG